MEETEYYGRPMVYIVTTSSGGFDILIFGNNCTAKRISLGTTSSQIQFKYKTGSSGSSGYLYIYTVNAILSTCIFELNTYSDTIGVLSNSDSTEFNSGSAF